MPIDDAGNAAAADGPKNEDTSATQTFGETVMEAITAAGTTISASLAEASRCVRSCVYPAKQKCVQIYDELTNNFATKGTRNIANLPTASRFGNDCGMSE